MKQQGLMALTCAALLVLSAGTVMARKGGSGGSRGNTSGQGYGYGYKTESCPSCDIQQKTWTQNNREKQQEQNQNMERDLTRERDMTKSQKNQRIRDPELNNQ